MQRNRDSVAAKLNVFAAFLCSLFGISYMLAWFLEAASFLQIISASTPVHFNAAVMLTFIGLSLFCISMNRYHMARVLAFATIVISTLTLYEYLRGVNLHIDQSIVRDFITSPKGFPGRPSPNTVTCSLLISLTIFLRGPRISRVNGILIELLGSAVFALGITATLGYLSGITAAYAWGSLTHMPLQSAILFAIVGKLTTLYGWISTEKNYGKFFGSFARPIFFSFVAISLALWQAISVEEHSNMAKTIELAAAKTGLKMQEQFQKDIREVSDLGLKWNDAPVSQQEFDTEVVRLDKDFDEIDRIAFFDKHHKLIYLHSESKIGIFDDQAQRQQLAVDAFLDKAEKNQKTLVSDVFEIYKDRQNVLVVSPTFMASGISGFIVAVVDLHRLAEKIIRDHVDYGFWVLVTVEEKPTYGSNEIGKFAIGTLAQDSSFSSYGVDWDIYLYPSQALVSSIDSFLPWVVLISGVIIAMLAALMAHLMMKSQLREIRVNEVNGKLLEEIKRREKAEKELLAARDIADASSRSKSIFLANISHEIRTPIGAMIGFAELMRASDGVTEYQRSQYLNTIVRNGDLLLRLIDDILDLSKVEAGKIELEHIETSLIELFSDIQVILGTRAQAKNLDFMLKAEGPVPSKIYTDPTRLRQILFNLVGNAIKFTDKGQVTLEVRAILPHEGMGKELIFTVKDTGIGLDAEQRRRLFQPFSQGDSATTRKFGGTGLGLDLSRKLAVALGGNIQLLESVVGSGSTFVASVACDPLPDCDWITRLQPETWKRKKVALANVVDQKENLNGLKVLLVEDAIDNQILFNHFLALSGAKVDIANDGLEGVEMATKNTYDVVLMDLQMPGLNGYEATSRLRGQNFTQPIIALTAHAMKEELSRCLAAGFTDYISKPVKFAALVEILQKFKRSVVAQA